jgi:hypothetical protein
MKALKFTISALALAISSVAAAENLIRIGEDVDGTIIYFDMDTVKKSSDGHINVWGINDTSKDKTLKSSTIKVLLKINCSNTTLQRLYSANYDANGRIISSGSFDEPPKPAIPGTAGYAMVEAVCARYQ